MLRVGVVGINHKLADLKLREQLAKACQKRFGPLHAVYEGNAFILLSTCNRTEIYFSSDNLASTHSLLLNILRLEVEEEFDHKLYSYFGLDCFCHLTRVTAGLDSAIIAETEIQGQVKGAYENIAECHSLPKELHFLFQKSLSIAKKIRSELDLGRGMPCLEQAILQAAKNVLSVPEKARLLFVGASEINQKILTFLKAKQFQSIALCNRSNEQAHLLSLLHGIEYLPWDHLHQWHSYDWIIFGTKSPDYLITRKDIQKQPISHKLIMDLSVPRNVEPKVGQENITLLNIDQINRLLNMRHHNLKHTLAEAEKKITEATAQHALRYTEKSHSSLPLFAATA